jgi:hypothetical protein
MRESTASAVADAVRRRGRRRFYRAANFDGPRSAVERALERLCVDGELVRVRNGLYWRGVDTPLGMSPTNPREVLSELAHGHAAGPAGLSAANRFGLTTQVPRTPEYAVCSWNGRPIERLRTVNRTGARAHGRDTARLNETEVAFLEVLDSFEDTVEVGPADAVARLTEALHGREVRPDRLARVAPSEPARVRARLRYLFERAGLADLAAAVPGGTKPARDRDALRVLGLAA